MRRYYQLYIFLLVISFSLILLGCNKKPDASKSTQKAAVTMRYIPIGDSYTKGEGVSPEEAWPSLLTRHLQQSGVAIELIASPAQTNWTTIDAIEKELPVYKQAKPTFTTLLIGANDWAQGISASEFEDRLTKLVEQMLAELENKQHFILLTIPDFSVTPYGKEFVKNRNNATIEDFNAVITKIGKRYNLKVVDLFLLSQAVVSDSSLIAADGLHPSAKEHARWESAIYKAASELLAVK